MRGSVATEHGRIPSVKDGSRKLANPAPAVTRAAAILDVLAGAGTELTLTDISRSLDIAKSSTSNLCNALEEAGLIQRRESGNYVLGRKVVQLGGAYLRSFDIVREFYRLCSASDILAHELTQLAVLDGTHVLYLARHEGHAPLRLSASIGDRFPASITAVGNILLAQLPPAIVAERFRAPGSFPHWTENSVTTVAALQEKLAAARERGYSLDIGETNAAVVGLAVLVRPRTSAEEPMGLGVSLFNVEDLESRVAEIVGELRKIADGLSNPMLPPRS